MAETNTASSRVTVSSLFELMGRRGSLWFSCGIISGFGLAVAEMAFAIMLSALFQAAGLMQSDLPVSGVYEMMTQLSLPWLFGSAALIVLARGFLTFLGSQTAIVVFETVNARLRLMAIHELLASKRGFISSSQIYTRISEIFPYAAKACHQLSIGLPKLIQCLVLLVFMFMTAWKESLLGLSGMLIVAFYVWQSGRSIRKIATKVPEEQEELLAGVERSARNWLLIKILRTDRREIARLSESVLKYSTHLIGSKFLANLNGAVPLTLGGFILLSIIGLNTGVWSTPPEVLISFLYLFMRFVQFLSGSSQAFGQINSIFPHLSKAMEYFSGFTKEQVQAFTKVQDSVSAVGRDRGFSMEPIQTQSLKLSGDQQDTELSGIHFDHVSFGYSKDDEMIFRDLSLDIQAGEQFGIVGRSGSGKSTFLGLLLGVLQPLKGEVRFNSLPVDRFLAAHHLSIGYVGAEAFLIEGSLRENLIYGLSKEVPEDEIHQAMQMAQIHGLLSKPGGLDFRIESNGEGLSAGQKQRLSLARALLSKPQLLVLDEPTANVDSGTEAEIAEVISRLKGQSTVLIVSHRPGILKYCDRVYDLENNEMGLKMPDASTDQTQRNVVP